MSTTQMENIGSFYEQSNQISDIIRCLRIVIDFVASSGCATETKIMSYAVDTLRMTELLDGTSVVSKLINDLDMGYLRSLWHLLNMRRAILLTQHGQDSFDQLNDDFKCDVDGSQFGSTQGDAADLENKLTLHITRNRKHFGPSNLFKLLYILYQFITNKLIEESRQQSKQFEVEHSSSEFDLNDALCEFNDELSSEQTATAEAEMFDLGQYCFTGIQVKHIWFVWKLLVKIYSTDSSKQ